MLGLHLSYLMNALAQMEGGLGIPIPSVTAARESLEFAKLAPEPVELEQRLNATHALIYAIAEGRQPAPNSLLSSLIANVEQYRKMKEHVAGGKQVAWSQEQISINGTVYVVFIGAWPTPLSEPEPGFEPPSKGSPPKRSRKRVARPQTRGAKSAP